MKHSLSILATLLVGVGDCRALYAEDDGIANQITASLTNNLSAITTAVRDGICTAADKLDATTDIAGVRQVKKFIGGIDGVAITANLDVADYLKFVPKWIDVSGGIETTVFYKDGKLRAAVYAVPQAGLEAGAQLKSSTGIKMSVTSGCGGSPDNYSGYFATGGLANVSFSLGLDGEKVGACLYEGYRYLSGEGPSGVPSRSWSEIRMDMKTSGFDTPIMLNQIDAKHLETRGLNVPLNVGNIGESSMTASTALTDLKKFFANTPELSDRSFSAQIDALLGRVESLQTEADFAAATPLLLTEFDKLQDRITEYSHKIARSVYPLTLWNQDKKVLNRAVGTLSWSDWSGIPWSKTQENWTEWAKAGMTAACSDPEGSRFYVLTEDTFYYDCANKQVIPKASLTLRQDAIPAAARAITNARKLLTALGEARHVLSNAGGKLRQKSPFSKRDARVGGIAGAGCDNPLSGCNSITVPAQNALSIGANVGKSLLRMQKMQQTLSNMKTGIFDALKNPSIGASLSHYYKIKEVEIPLGRAGELAMLLANPCGRGNNPAVQPHGALPEATSLKNGRRGTHK